MPTYFEEELEFLEYWIAKPKVEGHTKKEIIDIEVMDLPLVDPIFLNECECMMAGNDQGVVCEYNGRVQRKKSLQENTVEEDHTKIASPIDEQDKLKGASSQHKYFVTKERELHWKKMKQ